MTKPTVRKPFKTGTRNRAAAKSAVGRIHPVVIYPFHSPEHFNDLKCLYELIARLNADKATYARPITVMDCKTHRRKLKDARHMRFREQVVARHSDILDAWNVDTCQMWYSGLGQAFERGAKGDTYWLIPGDFDYGSPMGQDVLSRLHDLPEICDEICEDICIGEIATDHNNSKDLIDTYGTFAMLYHWFPKEAREIHAYTERPRSEFFAIRHEFLSEMLHRRWYAYEQTMVMLLHAIFGKKCIARFFVGNITDLAGGRDTLSSAMQQIERTERVLKSLWRERHHEKTNWSREYRELEAQSEQVRRTAFVLLEHMLH